MPFRAWSDPPFPFTQESQGEVLCAVRRVGEVHKFPVLSNYSYWQGGFRKIGNTVERTSL